MPFYRLITMKLSEAELLLLLPVSLLGVMQWRMRRAQGISWLERSALDMPTKMGIVRWLQAICLGMMFALCGAVLFITHEHSKQNNARLIQSQPMGAAEARTPR